MTTLRYFSMIALPLMIAAPGLAHDRGDRSVTAVRMTSPPTIDGKLSAGEWEEATPVVGLIQDEPDNGEPASEATEIRVAYDDRALYVAARLDDSQPVTKRVGRRDRYVESDWFTIYLDPHHDHRTGVRLSVNPAGVQRDWLLYDESGSDRGWDAVWSSAVTIDDGGWSVEIAIPYSQLRFSQLESYTWGINFERYISRRNEIARLYHRARDQAGLISLFPHLVGIEGIRPARNLELIPYLVGRTRSLAESDPHDPFNQDNQLEGSAGATIKYGLSSNLTLTGTINPDFGQVEVDPAVVNLTAFETFYPERRPFFLEGSDAFRFRIGGLFHTRRVGRSPQGGVGPADFSFRPRETTILGAAKITGKTSSGWSIGILDAITDEERGRYIRDGDESSIPVEPMTNYFAARLKKDLEGSSDIGILFTSVVRDDPVELQSLLRETSSVLGVDGTNWFGDRDYLLEWALATSHVTGTKDAIARTQRSSVHYYGRPDASHIDLDADRESLSGWAGKLKGVKASGKWRAIASLESFSPGFEPNDLGYLSRADTARGNFVVARREFDPGRFRNWDVLAGYRQQRNFDGDVLSSTYALRGSLTFLNYWSLRGGLEYDEESFNDRATRGGPLTRDPAGRELDVSLSTDSRRNVAVEASLYFAEADDGGFRRRYGLDVGFQPFATLAASLDTSYYRQRRGAQYIRTIADDEAVKTYGARYVFGRIDRTTLQIGARLQWAYSPTLSVQVYLQPFVASGDYADFSELARPGSRDYVVYGRDRGTIDFDPASGYVIDPDGAGEAESFVLRNPDFNVRSLRGNLVIRWEYRPGAAIHVAWTRAGSEVERFGDFDFGRDASGIFGLDSDDVFLIKIAYWLGL